MGLKIIKVPPDFAHPRDSDGVFIPGAHLELLYSLSPEQRTHFQYYETVSEGTPASPIFQSQEALEQWMVANENSRRFTSNPGANLVRRNIPGIREVKGREFMYLESKEGETFHQLVNSISSMCPNAVMPQSGGAGGENVRIKLKDNIALMGISYKGDIKGWRARFVGFCKMTSRKYGFIREGRLFLSDDSSQSLEDVEISFEK